MSDPVTNVEIEDVLSSIRRLISEEGRPESRLARDLVERRKEQDAQRSRLVLTPSLRVTTRNHPPQDEAAPSPEEMAPDTPELGEVGEATPSGQADDAPWKDPNTTLYEAAANAGDRDDAPEAEPMAIDSGEELVDLAELGETDEGADEVDTSRQTDAESDRDFGQEDLGEADAEIAEEDQAEDLHQDAWDDVASHDGEEDTLEEAAEATIHAEASEQLEVEAPSPELGDITDAIRPTDDNPPSDMAGAGEMAAEEEPADAPDPVIAPVGAAEEGETGEDDARMRDLGAKVAALEAAIGRTKDQWEPDGAVGDDYAGGPVETMEWQDHEPEAQPEPVAEAQPGPEFSSRRTTHYMPQEEEENALDPIISEEAILDEESLRELVSDIVRQELQGALGERITRNVRKLVRREIHRALTAQELE